MTPFKTSLALLALLTLAACQKNKHEITDNDLVKTPSSQKPNLLSEETQIKPYWERSQSLTAGPRGKLSIVPFDESQLFKSNQVQRRMLVINDNAKEPFYVEVFPVAKISEDNLNRVLAAFISFDKNASEKMIENFEGTILLYDKHKKAMGGLTYKKRVDKPGSAVISVEQDNSRMNPPAEECWYVVLTTTYIEYFSDGTSYTWSESSIVGQFCAPTTTGGGGGNSACSNTLSEMVQGTALAEDPTITNLSETQNTRTKIYTWKFYRQNFGMWYFESAEKGVHVKVNNVWKWQSLTHESITRSGFVAGGNVDCLLVSATPTVGQFWAAMELKYKVKAEIVCEGFPVSVTTSTMTSANYFNVNN